MLSVGATLYSQVNQSGVTGSWMGLLDAGVAKIRLGFNISLSEDGLLKATMDSPDQGALGIPMGEVTIWDDSIKIDAPFINGFYKGKIISISEIEGIWSQGGQKFILNLKTQTEDVTLNRPQEPVPPFPYSEEEITFTNNKEGILLAGTITRPPGEGPFPAVILVTGSGAQNRDEEVFGHKPFRVIADYLGRNGIVVLRYDDRGIGGSGGTSAGATSADFASDTRAGFDYIKKLGYVDSEAVGVIGHSEGGLIAMLLASEYEDVDFIITMAGPGTRGEKILTDQREYISRLSNIPDSTIAINTRMNNRIFEIMLEEATPASGLEKIDQYVREFLTDLYGDIEEIDQVLANLHNSIGGDSYNWIRYFLASDPAELLKSVKCPVLILNGDLDCQVIASENGWRIEKALKDSGNDDVSLKVLPGLNHIFQHAKTGLPDEYVNIEETVSPEVLEIISEWINNRF